MASTSAKTTERAILRASEVCEIAGVQPYVLRTWEAEFQNLGVARSPGGPRFYRQQDVERVLHIKQLLFVEGLTLAGVRRRLDEGPPADSDELPLEALLGDDARRRLADVKTGLRWILEVLSAGAEGGSQASADPPSFALTGTGAEAVRPAKTPAVKQLRPPTAAGKSERPATRRRVRA